MKTALIAALCVCAPALAGDLNPPPGPVAPTMKTLDEVEARTPLSDENTPGNAGARFVIDSSGSYYLTSNVNAGIDQHGIDVNASGVTIDLNGFRLVGSEGSTGPVNGIEATAIGDLTVMNGTITLFSGRGIRAGSGAKLSGLTISELGVTGVELGVDALITGCVSTNNGGNGYFVDDGAVISDSIASGCGIAGFFVRSRCSVTNCTARNNSGNGFSLGDDSMISRCIAEGNQFRGVEMNESVVVEECLLVANSFGIVGITACTIKGNTVRENTGGGIVVGTDCVISGNTCSGNRNPAAGVNAVAIQTLGRGNFIDGNRLIDNNIGIQTLDTGNSITRNHAEGNDSSYDNAGGSNFSPIQTTYPGAGPWDNFDF